MQDAINSSVARKGSKHVLSYGGGVNTVALMVLLIEKDVPFDEAVFADTGSELPETYEYLKVAEVYLEAHGIPLRIVRSKNGTLYDTCKKRGVIPSKIWRWSTRDYKIVPLHAYYRSLRSHIYEYLGIAYDEIERVKPSRAPYVTSIFPLVDYKITRQDCIRIIKDAGLPAPVKSRCFFCPFQTLGEWKEIYTDHRGLYFKAMELEEGSKHFPRQKLTPLGLRGLMRENFNGYHEVGRNLEEKPCEAYCMT